MKVKDTQSLTRLARLRHADLLALDAAFKATHISDESDGFDSYLVTPKDRKDAKEMGIPSIKELMKNNKHACFANLHTNKELIREVAGRYGVTSDMLIDDFMCFRGFYAMKHDDQHMEPTHQLMFILDNGGHRLWSIGRKSVLVPKRGDVVVLDIFKKHALFPNVRMSAKGCERKPLKFILAGFCFVEDSKW